MSKIAFVFPGQGSQTVGMCKAFYDEYPVVKQIFEEADDALGYSISKMCFEGPAEDLKLTANTPACYSDCQHCLCSSSEGAWRKLRYRCRPQPGRIQRTGKHRRSEIC